MTIPRLRPAPALPLLATLLGALLLSGCAITAKKPPPPPEVPAQFKEDSGWKRATPAAPVTQAWWQSFDDPVLNDLQGQLVIGNQNLQAALAQVASARATLSASEVAWLPTLSLGAGATRSSSVETNNGRTTNTSYSLTANVGWELDLWGRLSQAVTAAGATAQASLDDLAAVKLSAQSTLVQTYFALRLTEAQQALLQRTTAANQRALELTQARYTAGVASQSDVLQAQTQLKSVQAQAADAVLQRAQYEHAIAVLLGKAPADFSIAPTASLPPAPGVPALLPSTLLERRPDIASAERRVAAAYAQIGVADAAWFPDLSLSASGGFRSNALSGLVSTANRVWSFGPALAFSILDSGQRQLASAQARASADQATANYRQAVLVAFQEVEDNLAAMAQLEAQASLQADALQAARRNLEIVTDQYRAGTVSFLNVVTAQTSALSAESSLLSVRNRQLAAANLLLKNVGGRWEPLPASNRTPISLQ